MALQASYRKDGKPTAARIPILVILDCARKAAESHRVILRHVLLGSTARQANYGEGLSGSVEGKLCGVERAFN